MSTPSEGLHFQEVTKSFGEVTALKALELAVGPGEIVAITGPSGAGKTTACRIVCGLETLEAGEIFLGGAAIQALPPQRRSLAYMFESFALYPQLSVFDNVAFPLRAPSRRGAADEREIGRRVQALLTFAEIAALAHRLPSELSGGQKQRVALCRALAQDPSAYLLDEPISHLDAKLRHRLRGEIRRRLKQSGVPSIWCTPDGLEALSVADRMAVLIDGTLEQVGPPERVYLEPASARVARLIGDPPTNLLAGRLAAAGGGLAFRCDGLSIALPDSIRQRLAESFRADDVFLGVRPTDVAVTSAGQADLGAAADVYTYEPFGKYGITTVRIAGQLIKSKSFDQPSFRPGDPVRVSFNDAALLFFDPVTEKSI